MNTRNFKTHIPMCTQHVNSAHTTFQKLDFGVKSRMGISLHLVARKPPW